TDTANFSISALSTGSHTITAAYTSGDANFGPSPMSSSITQTVNAADTTTTVISDTNTSVSGHGVSFAGPRTVKGPGTHAAANPTGLVTFYDGGVAIGTGTLSGTSTDTATLTTSTLTTGAHTITAQYTSGDANFIASAVSSSITQTVNKANTTTAVT